ncbi:pickpocket protein 28-like [Anopheles marshallii]|uniref:pickpocket protein 28-like n=1 Tax=Anopheles marshallii TaxID=1521116 RepID=UPI00237A2EF1|nr:pickpocket protein 28-like [Anopheles marshallii]
METVDKIILQQTSPNSKDIASRTTHQTEHDDGILKDYLRNSSFPIVRYLLGSNLRVTLKVFWLVVVVCLTGLFGFTVVVNYERLKDPSNVYLTEAEKALPMWSVPFPAVTLCPRKGRCVSEQLQLEQFCVMVCWQDVCTNECDRLMDAVRTERGVCYTFNAVAGEQIFKTNNLVNVKELSNASRPTENWDFLRGLQIITSVLVKQYPRAAQDMSGRYRLKITVSNEQNETLSDCSNPSLEAFVHSPIDFPFKLINPTAIPFSAVVQLRVFPKLVRSQRYLRYFTSSTSGCISQVQNPLKLFSIYTQSNCEMECHTEYFLTKRGCVLDHMPRSHVMNLCNSTTNYRPYDVLDKIVSGQLREQNIPRSQFFRRLCNCLPACVDFRYRAEPSSYTVAVEPWSMESNSTESLNSQLVVELAEDHFYPLVRSVRYSVLDFVGDFGGLIALFLGSSIVSLVEVFFFCFLKPAVVR